jgi:hypothetical protein
LVAEQGAGWVVPVEDPERLAVVLREALSDRERARTCAEAASRLAESFRWERILGPLLAFFETPRCDPTKADFAFSPDTAAPADSLDFRARRWLRRHWGWRSSR